MYSYIVKNILMIMKLRDRDSLNLSPQHKTQVLLAKYLWIKK